MEEERRIVLRTYNSVWKIPRKLYSIDNIKLLMPIDQDQAVYFIASGVITYFLLKILPFLGYLPFVFKYIAIPYGIMKFLTKQKLDGKMPHKFFLDYLLFKVSGSQCVRFSAVKEQKTVCFTTPIVYRMPVIVNLTGFELNKKESRWRFPPAFNITGRRSKKDV
jgi:hypothetical protein